MPALAGKRQQIFMTAVFAAHTGKTIMEITAIQITQDYLTDIRAKKSILSVKSVFIYLLKCFKIVLNALVVR